jgi:tetratricopeptide (TPR) repeat protein
VCAATVVLAGITAGVVACRKKRPYLLVGWLWYLGMLVPVIGIIQISYYAHADRYTYLPEIGLALALTWAVAEGSAGWKNRRAALGGLMAAAAGALTVCGCVQTSYWRDSQSLWTRALSCTSSNSVACLNLGGAYYAKKDWENAIKQYRQALEFRPVYAKARYNLGNAFFAKGDRAGAIEQYRQAVEIKPEYAEAHNNLGIALAVDGKLDEAITHFQKTLEIEPHYAEAQFNLGKALYGKGDREAAIAQYRKALEINPADARARDNLGSVLLELAWMLATTPDSSLRNGARAEALATQASQLSGSGNPAILRTLAAAYAEQGSYGPAAAAARRALEMAARQKQDALAAALQQEIKLYEANKPFRNAPQ